MPGSLFRSAYTRPDIAPCDVIAFHRMHFGDARMSNDDGALNGGGGDAGSGSGGDSGAGGDGGAPGTFIDPDTGETYQFPKDTPLTEMTEGQRTEYWRHKARKHESAAKSRADYDTIKAERDQLKQANETESEKAIREAREAGKVEARTESVNDTVKAMLRMGLRARGVKDDDLDEIVSTINLSAHADEQGLVNDEKVLRTIYRLAGTAGGGSGPDTGQGNRGTKTAKSGVSAGAELYAASRGKKTDS